MRCVIASWPTCRTCRIDSSHVAFGFGEDSLSDFVPLNGESQCFLEAVNHPVTLTLVLCTACAYLLSPSECEIL
jgi:hypothetical protein